MNEFFTISKESVFESVEKRSKFISYSFKISSPQDIKEKLSAVKAKHWDAKHHVYAYVLNRGNILKFSDDGEPGGTGGMPVLNAIQSANLKNTLVIVVRYFGGILLGTSGLRAAYKFGAENVLKLSGQTLLKRCKKANFEVDYSKYSWVLSCAAKFDGKILESKFEDAVKLMVAIPDDKFEKFSKYILQFCENISLEDIAEEYIYI